MMEIKVFHGNPDRTLHQNVIYETADGKFRYRLDMDYCKGLPRALEAIPYLGKVAGGFCDAKDNLYVILRGGGQGLNPGPNNCLIRLDPNGNYINTFAENRWGGMVHFGNVTAEGTILLAIVMQNQILEMTMDGEVIRTIGEGFRTNGNKRRDKACDVHWTRIHNGILPTEPFHGIDFGVYEKMKDFERTEYCEEPFNNPNDVDVDSKGNIYVSDGYGNFAIHKFDRTGKRLKTWGGKGVFDAYTDTPGRFVVPHAICVDANDHVWLCDREKDAVHVFDDEGNCIAYCSRELSQPSGIDTDGKYVYVAGRGGYLTIFDLDCNIVGELGFFNGNLRAHDLAADSAGNLYLFPTRANYEHQVIALKRID